MRRIARSAAIMNGMNGVDVISDLEARGLIHDSTDLEVLRGRLAEGPIGAYVGFDPTADSLHAGHLLGQLGLRRLQLAGHRPFPLAGGATGMIGDPSGKSEERNLLDRDTLAHNVTAIRGQLERLLDFEPGPHQATLVDNADWTAGTDLLAFLRDVGKHITINQMMAKDSVRSRLDGEAGISYTEFSYMLLQANDFRHLHDEHGVELQLGGSDQWGNITAGIDLIRRTAGRSAYGMTWPLLMRTDGEKFGKTAGGAVWLDGERTSPYQFRQFWIQADDTEIVQRMKWFSLRPLDEIEALLDGHGEAPHRRLAQRALADELTELVHGAEAATTARAAADVLFGGDPTGADEATIAAIAREVPTADVAAAALGDAPALFADAGVTASRGEARRLIDQRGIRVNGVQLGGDVTVATVPLLHDRWMLVRRGKTAYSLLEISSS